MMNHTVNTNKLRKDIINVLTRIDDVKKLKLIFQQAEEIEEMNIVEDEQSLNIEDGIVEVREGVTLDQLLKEQNYKPINYQEFKSLTDEIEWEHSLEELLENLD
ncbi:MAG: hypothetical protein NXI08_17205 [bacterium]|jgi:hypothetical protein|nr:hypothetical protein [bacterium]